MKNHGENKVISQRWEEEKDEAKIFESRLSGKSGRSNAVSDDGTC